MPFPRLQSWVPGSLLVSLCVTGAVLAAKPGPPPAPAAIDFARDIQPLLQKRCFACHGGGQSQGGLRLDTRAEALRGGDTGSAFQPGHAAESLLLQRVSGAGPKHVMPPAGPRLTPTDVQRLRQWIDSGAAWPVAGAGPGAPRAAGPGGRGKHWSFQPIREPRAPAVKDQGWVKTPIDAFVLARLEKEGLRPSPEADRVTLIRRLSVDLLGLLPTPEEVDAFLKDCQSEEALLSVKPQALGVKPHLRKQDLTLNAQRLTPPPQGAYERLVDRLLASPHYGERWGRHWLDLARYADSDGYEKDLERPYAYVYRDWVIDALNRDLPFDQFTVQQLAGDLLVNQEARKAGIEEKGNFSGKSQVPGFLTSSFPYLPADLQRMVVATGFHRNTLKNREGGADQEEDRVKATLDRANTTGTVWLGLTVGCAQCHSHKFDPITQREYYGLYAFFNTVSEIDLPYPAPGEPKRAADPRIAAIITESSKPPTTHLLVRGDFLRPGEEIQPHSLAVLPSLTPASAQPTRLDLARWLVAPENPLTARVAVNRVWGHLFGQGLVTTPDDFGLRGARPSHPELLDWLAATFRGVPSSEFQVPGISSTKDNAGSGTRNQEQRLAWSQKRLIRLLVTSAAYRQSSRNRAELQTRDPRNVLLARQSRFRPEAEIVRDLYLSASGLLTPKIGGPSIRPPLPGDIAALGYASSLKWTETTGPDRYRRGMYVFFQRTVPYPQLVQFDAPDGNSTCTRRERSNTPLQALTLLNDPVFVECARALGLKLAQEPSGSPEARMRLAFRRCLSRAPSAAEAARLQRLFGEMLSLCKADPTAAAKLAGKGLPAGVDPAEAAAWMTVARTVLNLDEFITRE
jgi:mono/diheme cytochrome c family protein